MARHCILLISFWPLYKVVWTKSLEDYLFARTCKSVTWCLHKYKENNKVTYTNCEYPSMYCVPVGQLENVMTSESKTRLKHGRPIGSNDIVPKKRKTLETIYEKLGTLEELTNTKELIKTNDEAPLDK